MEDQTIHHNGNENSENSLKVQQVINSQTKYLTLQYSVSLFIPDQPHAKIQ
jgi:hypothetical protein